MYVAAWTASLQRQFASNLVGTATYLGNKGTDLLTTTYTNVLNPITGLRPYLPLELWHGGAIQGTAHSTPFNTTFEELFRMAGWSPLITCGHTPSMMEVSEAESRTRFKMFSAGRATRPAATMMSGRFLTHPPFINFYLAPADGS